MDRCSICMEPINTTAHLCGGSASLRGGRDLAPMQLPPLDEARVREIVRQEAATPNHCPHCGTYWTGSHQCAMSMFFAQALASKLPAADRALDAERQFPLQTSCAPVKPGPVSIPWSVAEKAYGAYSARYGRSQSLEQLAERAGFSWGEMDDLYPPWRDEIDELAKLRARVAELERHNIEKRDTAFQLVADACDRRLQRALDAEALLEEAQAMLTRLLGGTAGPGSLSHEQAVKDARRLLQRLRARKQGEQRS